MKPDPALILSPPESASCFGCRGEFIRPVNTFHATEDAPTLGNLLICLRDRCEVPDLGQCLDMTLAAVSTRLKKALPLIAQHRAIGDNPLQPESVAGFLGLAQFPSIDVDEATGGIDIKDVDAHPKFRQLSA